jgi:TPR repeat protein
MNTTCHSIFRSLATLLLGLLCLIASHNVAAGPFEQGVIAYQNKEFRRAHDIWLPLAENGHVLAQTLLGALYAYGEGVERNDAEAVKWFERAAYGGSAQAQYNLGILYENGWGVAKSPIRARYWYRRAADQGRKDAASRYTLLGDATSETSSSSDEASEQQQSKPVQPDATELMPGIPISSPADNHIDQANRTGTPTGKEADDRSDWLRAQPAGHYTLQLIASTDLQQLRNSISSLGVSEPQYAIVESRQDTKTWYGLIYGSYKTVGEAQQAMQSLPAALRHYRPWIRPFSDIKSWREQSRLMASPEH